MTNQQHFLDASIVHYEWNNAIPPRLDINAGDTVVFETRDASDEFYKPNSTHEDVMRRVFKGHPLTGPVRIRGARPGDVLAVEIIEVAPRASFGWIDELLAHTDCRHREIITVETASIGSRYWKIADADIKSWIGTAISRNCR